MKNGFNPEAFQTIHRVIVGTHRGVDHQVVHGVSKHALQRSFSLTMSTYKR